MANLTYGRTGHTETVDHARAANGGDYLNHDHGGVNIPGREGPFKEFLFPGMGDGARYNRGGVRVSSGNVETQLGRYNVQGIPTNPRQSRSHAGPIAGSTVMGELDGWTQALNELAVLHANTAHEIATMKVSRFWINQIKSEPFKPFNGWESRVTIFRGGLLHQSGTYNWRRIQPVPARNLNNPSTFPGFETVMSTTEELTGTGYETGWGSENINLDYLRNSPDAKESVKEQLDMGVDMAIALRESYNRENYTKMACLMRRAFVMACDCEPTEDSGSRVFLFDSNIVPDAVEVTGSAQEIAAIKTAGVITLTGGVQLKIVNPGAIADSATSFVYGLTDDRADFTNSKVAVVLDSLMTDCYGQIHMFADVCTDPKTGAPNPVCLIDAGPAGEPQEVEPLNFDMLERLTEDLEARCPEQAVGQDGDAPVFAATIKSEDIDKLIRATPIEWDAWRRAEPRALITHYGISKAKIYRRWAIVNDTNQLRFKPIRYIPNYTEAEAKKFGYLGYRDGDDQGLQGRGVYVCVVVDKKILAENRRGTNGYKVPVNNPEYFDAPIALMNVFIRDTFVNQIEGPTPQIGMGTHFGPGPAMGIGQWGFLNIQDKKTNPFCMNGNFYGLIRCHMRPTRYTQDACAFVYARDVRAFKAFTQAENKIINPDYTGVEQAAKVIGAKGAGLATTDKGSAKKLVAGKAYEFTLAMTPHLVLAAGSVIELGKQDHSTGAISGKQKFAVLASGLWPRVTLAPIADIEDDGSTKTELTDMGIVIDDSGAERVISFVDSDGDFCVAYAK